MFAQTPRRSMSGTLQLLVQAGCCCCSTSVLSLFLSSFCLFPVVLCSCGVRVISISQNRRVWQWRVYVVCTRQILHVSVDECDLSNMIE